MQDVLDIAEVVRRTGLTSRALRFYEARGLLKPLRTHAGRRLYGPGELERINQITALKQAGLSLAQIETLIARKPIALAALVAAQLDAIAEQERALGEAKALLRAVKRRLDAGESVDVATFCDLIRNGGHIMESEKWGAITERYLTPEARSEWESRYPADFDQDGYSAKWKDLGGRIKAALPLDPASPPAQAFVDEWFALLEPFRAVATPAMWDGAYRMYDDMGSWEGQADPGFDREVWEFVKLASAQRLVGSAGLGGAA